MEQEPIDATAKELGFVGNSGMLPCPFCGGEPDIKQTGRNKLKLKCKRCLIGIEQKTLRFGLDWLKEQMISDWNNRV